MRIETVKALILFLVLFAVWQVLYSFALDELLAYTIVLVVLAGFLFLDKQSLASLGFRRPSSWKRYAGIGLILGAVFVMYVFTLGSALFASDPESLIRPLIFTVNLGVLSVPYVAALALAVALVEETSFRGYILRNLIQSFSHRRALLFSAILFGLYHISWFYIYYSPLPPSQTFTYWSSFIVYAFVGGVFLGYFYMNTERTTIGPIAYHWSIIFIQSFVPYTLPFSTAAGHGLITIPILLFIPLLVFLKRNGWLGKA